MLPPLGATGRVRAARRSGRKMHVYLSNPSCFYSVRNKDLLGTTKGLKAFWLWIGYLHSTFLATSCLEMVSRFYPRQGVNVNKKRGQRICFYGKIPTCQPVENLDGHTGPEMIWQSLLNRHCSTSVREGPRPYVARQFDLSITAESGNLSPMLCRGPGG